MVFLAFTLSLPPVSVHASVSPAAVKKVQGHPLTKSVPATQPKAGQTQPNKLLKELIMMIQRLKAVRFEKEPTKPTEFKLIAQKGKNAETVTFEFTGDACGRSGLMCPDLRGLGILKIIVSGKPNPRSKAYFINLTKDFVLKNQVRTMSIRPGDTIQLKYPGQIRLNSATGTSRDPIPMTS